MATVRTNSAVQSEILFTGQRYEPITQLYLFRMRWFDSIAGRFVSRDPIGYPDGPNLYAARFLVSSTDPFGLSPGLLIPAAPAAPAAAGGGAASLFAPPIMVIIGGGVAARQAFLASERYFSEVYGPQHDWLEEPIPGKSTRMQSEEPKLSPELDAVDLDWAEIDGSRGCAAAAGRGEYLDAGDGNRKFRSVRLRRKRCTDRVLASYFKSCREFNYTSTDDVVKKFYGYIGNYSKETTPANQCRPGSGGARDARNVSTYVGEVHSNLYIKPPPPGDTGFFGTSQWCWCCEETARGALLRLKCRGKNEHRNEWKRFEGRRFEGGRDFGGGDF
jgi:RHS repeat-associated protein